jgi:peptidoglycan hydrolase-like protein with peptidoglycan-binding domain
MKFVVIMLALSFIFATSGCGKKEAQEEALEPVTMDVLSTLNTQADTQAATEAVSQDTKAVAKLESLPPQGPYKPSPQQIQLALKNAGFYAGEVDGKLGPMSKKAVEEFQKANGLQADGKVGPKTWQLLSKYLALKND